MRKRTIVLAALVAAVAIPAVAFGSMSPVSSAKLTGKAETPAGDPNGSGLAVLHLDAKKGKVCWAFTKVKNIGTPNAAHIHKGKAGKAGAVVVPLGGAYKAKGCISASKSLVKDIEEYPNLYYANIHNAKYPGGAIRGQLAAGMTG
jgi:hypothetical protein